MSFEIRKYFCPGRVCLIGEHLDYNGGFVMPAAISLGIHATVKSRSDTKIICSSAQFSNTVEIDLSKPIEHEPGWGNYVKGVVKYLGDTGLKIPALEVEFVADLPSGAGLSSSASLEVLLAYILQNEAGAEDINLIKTALLCKDVENDFVGVKCGIMDQFSVATGKKEHAVILNCETLEHEFVPVKTGDYGFIIINSNKRRELAGSKFNERKSECETALNEIKKHKPIRSLGEATKEDVLNLIKNNTAQKRALHVFEENQRVLLAGKALKQGDLFQFGKLMNASHQSLKNNYEVTGIELDTIAENAITIDGCIGARMTGAGFGGCSIALVKKSEINSFKQKLNQIYMSKIGYALSFYEFEISDGVGQR
ncbi:MAG: Galactokinase [Bacteroidia bacterium]|nr:Galactokinase [Bacteroidia bacterium]